MRKINLAGLSLIKSFEGLRLKAYLDPVNILTIGYGHTDAAGPPKVTLGMKITAAEAEEILARDLGKYEAAVERAVTVPLTDNQFAALVSLCFNVGPGNFERSTLLKVLNAGNYRAAEAQFARWNRAKGRVLPGLSRRRAAEAELFASKAPNVGNPFPPPPDIPKPRPAELPRLAPTPEPAPQGFFARFVASLVKRLERNT